MADTVIISVLEVHFVSVGSTSYKGSRSQGTVPLRTKEQHVKHFPPVRKLYLFR
jgi:hypothetical protein